jgi:hypothetical protein
MEGQNYIPLFKAGMARAADMIASLRKMRNRLQPNESVNLKALEKAIRKGRGWWEVDRDEG